MQTNLQPLEQLRVGLHTALKNWHTPTDSALANLRVLRRRYRAAVPQPQGMNQLVLDLLDQLAGQNPEGTQVLRLHFLDRMDAASVAHQLNISEATVYRRQGEALDQLAAILYEEERTAATIHRTVMESRLELPSYEQLFGIEQHQDALLEQLLAPGPPWLLLLHGIGGIGKTALADALARAALAQDAFLEIGWVTARPHHFQLESGDLVTPTAPSFSNLLIEKLAEQLLDRGLPSPFTAEKALAMLQRKMKDDACLVVIDNLETVQDLDVLLPVLRRLSNPSKILLTSRHRLDNLPQIFPYQVPALSEPDALALIRNEATLRNLSLLAQADPGELRPIYETVGGNPLALRLIVGQAHRHALQTVLADLRSARGRSVEQLYTFIYRRAWDALAEEERRILLTMPLVPEEGADLAFLMAASGLEDEILHDGLETLVRYSLVDHRGAIQMSRYTIHSLTRTFLLQQVVQWQ